MVKILFCMFALFCTMSCRTADKSCAIGSSVYNDSVILCHWDSALVKGLNETKKAFVYRLHALSVADSTKMTIMGYPVCQNEVEISRCRLDMLRFMLNNENFYSDEKTTWKTPFSPYLAISIGDKSEQMYLLISYSTSEWALAKNGVIIRRNIYKRFDMLVQYALELFPNDEYLIYVYELNK